MEFKDAAQSLTNLALENRIKDLETQVAALVTVTERIAEALGRAVDHSNAVAARLQRTLETNNLWDGS